MYMEYLFDIKQYIFLALIVFILLFKIWRDLEFKETVNKKIDNLLTKYDNSSNLMKYKIDLIDFSRSLKIF